MNDHPVAVFGSPMHGRRCLLSAVVFVAACAVPLIAADAAPTAPAAVAADHALALDLRGALAMALQRNRALRVQSYAPGITTTGIDSAKATFDPTVTATVATGKGIDNTGVATTSQTADAGLSQYLATGTTWGVDVSSTRTRSDLYSDATVVNRAGVSINQALLQGFGTDANLASVRQAHIDADISRYELRGYTLDFVASVEEGYWAFALAVQQVDISELALDIARQQRDQIKEQIAVGKLADIELAAAEAEVALRNQFVIEARGSRDGTRLTLLRLINPEGAHPLDRPLTLNDKPFVPDAALDPVTVHIDVAERLRADLNEAKLRVDRGDLQLVKTKNGLLPKLDLFANLGRSTYASSFGGAMREEGGRSWDGQVGLSFSYALGNRAADASHRSAVLSREQVAAALDNQRQLVEEDVRSAYITVLTTREQVTASEATARAQAETARSEREKFRVGKSTSLLVAQAERDAFSSRINAAKAVVAHLTALIELYRLDGSLLDRRGVQAPGAEPVAAR
jgi:outer membrane protein TolC